MKHFNTNFHQYLGIVNIEKLNDYQKINGFKQSMWGTKEQWKKVGRMPYPYNDGCMLVKNGRTPIFFVHNIEETIDVTEIEHLFTKIK